MRANRSTEDVIDIEIAIDRPELRLQVPAAEESLPVVRQALRSLGETLDAEQEALEDAELALTEACANVVEHAYPDGGGEVEVSLLAREAEMLARVRDSGRGMSAQELEHRAWSGYGMVMIEAIARSLEVSVEGGTEVAMTFDLGAHEAVVSRVALALDEQPCARIMRRLVAVVAAQADMPVDRMMEALLVAELVARHSLPRLVGDRVRIRIVRDGGSFVIRLGPLEEQGAAATVRDSEVPAVGSIVERLADGVRVEHERVGGLDCEYLELRIEPRRHS